MRTPTELSLARQVLRKWQAALGKKRTVTSPLNNGGQPSHGRKRWHKWALKRKQRLILLNALSFTVHTTERKWSVENWGGLHILRLLVPFSTALCNLNYRFRVSAENKSKCKPNYLFPQCNAPWSPSKKLYQMETRSQFKWKGRNWEQDLLTQPINTHKLSCELFVSCAIVLWQILGHSTVLSSCFACTRPWIKSVGENCQLILLSTQPIQLMLVFEKLRKINWINLNREDLCVQGEVEWKVSDTGVAAQGGKSINSKATWALKPDDIMVKRLQDFRNIAYQ